MDEIIAEVVQLEQEGPVMRVWLNRPNSHNALNPALINRLAVAFAQLDRRRDVHLVVLSARGRSFCAGADLAFMKSAAGLSLDENVAAGHALFDLLEAIDHCRKPVIGRVNGAAIGGGIGLASCCDIVIAAEQARFGFSEVRLGLVPAVISPFVLARIGIVHGRELFLTGEPFDAHQAQRIGLVTQVVSDERALDAAVQERVEQLLMGAPGAHEAIKELLRVVDEGPREMVRDFTARLIARRRASEEGQEGMSAFLEKRRPAWQQWSKDRPGNQ